MKSVEKSAGFTLLEILIALAIFSIGVLAFSSLSVTATKAGSSSGQMSEAVTFAQDKIEDLKASCWEEIVSGTDRKSGLTGVDYVRTWTVFEEKAHDIKTVSVRIDWVDRAHHSISLFSVISR